MKILLFVFLTIITSFKALSEDVILTKCDYCTSDYETKQYAKFMASGESASRVSFLVINSSFTQVKKYRVVKVASREPGVPDIVQIAQISLTQQESQVFAKQLPLANKLMQDLSMYYEVDGYLADSAWDLFDNKDKQRIAASRAEFNFSLVDRYSSVMGLLVQLSNKVTGVNMYMTISFSDGTYARMYITGIDGSYTCDPQCPRVQFEIREIFDADGNQLPLNKSDLKTLNVIHTNNSASYNRAVDALIGAGLTGHTGSGSGETCARIVVNKDGSITCYLN